MKLKVILTTAVCLTLGMQANAQMRLLADAHYTCDGTNYVAKDSNKYDHYGSGMATPQYPIGIFQNQFDKAYKFAIASGNSSLTGRTTNTFTGGNLTEHIVESTTDGGSNWDNEDRFVVEYQGSHPDTMRQYYWSTWGSGSWRSRRKIGYVFSGANLVTETSIRYYTGQNSGWRNEYRNTRTYSSGNITSLTHEEWNNSSKVWENKTKVETSYNGSNQVILINNYVWDNGAWKLNDRDKYTYAGGKLDKIESEFEFNGNWIGSFRNTYTYGSGNFPTEMERERYDEINKFYVKNTKYYYQHNGGGMMTEERTESWDGVSAYKKTSNMDSMNRFYYFWPTSVGNTTAIEDAFSVYPSPAVNSVNIALKGTNYGQPVHFTVTDMSGRIIKRWTSVSNPKMNVSVADLPTGAYIMTATSANDIKSQRFTVEK